MLSELRDILSTGFIQKRVKNDPTRVTEALLHIMDGEAEYEHYHDLVLQVVGECIAEKAAPFHPVNTHEGSGKCIRHKLWYDDYYNRDDSGGDSGGGDSGGDSDDESSDSEVCKRDPVPKRPRGAAPKGYIWNYSEGEWELISPQPVSTSRVLAISNPTNMTRGPYCVFGNDCMYHGLKVHRPGEGFGMFHINSCCPRGSDCTLWNCKYWTHWECTGAKGVPTTISQVDKNDKNLMCDTLHFRCHMKDCKHCQQIENDMICEICHDCDDQDKQATVACAWCRYRKGGCATYLHKSCATIKGNLMANGLPICDICVL